jgi:hypothetical protein
MLQDREEKPPARFRIDTGDRVRMPDGRTGTVIDWNIRYGGHFLFVWVRPDRGKGWKRFLPVFTRTFVEDEIDDLERIEG